MMNETEQILKNGENSYQSKEEDKSTMLHDQNDEKSAFFGSLKGYTVSPDHDSMSFVTALLHFLLLPVVVASYVRDSCSKSELYGLTKALATFLRTAGFPHKIILAGISANLKTVLPLSFKDA